MSKRGKAKRQIPNEFQQKHAELDRKLDQIIKKAMPQMPKKFLKLGQKIENADIRQPATLKAEIERDIAEFIQRLGLQDAGLFQDMLQLAGDPAFGEELIQTFLRTIGITKEEAKKDNRYSLLMRLVNEAHARVPYSPWLVFEDYADPRVMWEVQFAPADLLVEAEQKRGEIRAKAVLRALVEVAEPLYKLYLNRIWLLSYFKEGELPKCKEVPSLGNLVTEAASRLSDYPGLVESDAGWMRNSACHNRRVYLPEEDAVEMWDKNKPRKKVPVDTLLQMVNRMYQISAVTLQRVAQVYLFRTMLVKSGVLSLLMEQASVFSSLDETKINMAEQEMLAKGKVILAPLENFINSHTKPTT
jgi:hypothetical protein